MHQPKCPLNHELRGTMAKRCQPQGDGDTMAAAPAWETWRSCRLQQTGEPSTMGPKGESVARILAGQARTPWSYTRWAFHPATRTLCLCEDRLL